jgi:DtxR family Mn-dependent transcriptional regulator
MLAGKMRRRRRGQIDEVKIDELLELIWTVKERGDTLLDHILEMSDEEDSEEVLKEMERRGLISIKNGRVTLEGEGDRRAEEIVRRHRLAEMLLSEVFDLEEEHIHSEACKFEHILSPEVTDSVCTFLGHPPMCPHGNPIPRGDCCAKFKREIKPLVVPLRELTPGEEGRIVFIVPRVRSRLDRLSTLGVVPGAVVRLHQKHPTYVIRVGETDLAVEEDIARDIYVKKLEAK